jgi:hypothetical protein
MEEGEQGGSLAPIAAAPQRLTGATVWRAHVTLVVGVAFCVVAFWFELGRAESGNSLSWAYVFEWPLLASFAVYMWWKVLHPEATKSERRAKKAPSLAPEYTKMLAAWEDHQRELELEHDAADAEIATEAVDES